MPDSGHKMQLIKMYVEAANVARLDAAAAALRQHYGGIKISRSDLIRRFIDECLPMVEDELADLVEITAVEAGESAPDRPTA